MPAYVAHNIPFMVVSGLGRTRQNSTILDGPGTRIVSEVSPVDSPDAQVLQEFFKDKDAKKLAWNGREHNGRNKFKIKIVGRVRLLISTSLLSYLVTNFLVGVSFTASHCSSTCSLCTSSQFSRYQSSTSSRCTFAIVPLEPCVPALSRWSCRC